MIVHVLLLPEAVDTRLSLFHLRIVPGAVSKNQIVAELEVQPEGAAAESDPQRLLLAGAEGVNHLRALLRAHVSGDTESAGRD